MEAVSPEQTEWGIELPAMRDAVDAAKLLLDATANQPYEMPSVYVAPPATPC